MIAPTKLEMFSVMPARKSAPKTPARTASERTEVRSGARKSPNVEEEDDRDEKEARGEDAQKLLERGLLLLVQAAEAERHSRGKRQLGAEGAAGSRSIASPRLRPESRPVTPR